MFYAKAICFIYKLIRWKFSILSIHIKVFINFFTYSNNVYIIMEFRKRNGNSSSQLNILFQSIFSGTRKIKTKPKSKMSVKLQVSKIIYFLYGLLFSFFLTNSEKLSISITRSLVFYDMSNKHVTIIHHVTFNAQKFNAVKQHVKTDKVKQIIEKISFTLGRSK